MPRPRRRQPLSHGPLGRDSSPCRGAEEWEQVVTLAHLLPTMLISRFRTYRRVHRPRRTAVTRLPLRFFRKPGRAGAADARGSRRGRAVPRPGRGLLRRLRRGGGRLAACPPPRRGRGGERGKRRQRAQPRGA